MLLALTLFLAATVTGVSDLSEEEVLWGKRCFGFASVDISSEAVEGQEADAATLASVEWFAFLGPELEDTRTLTRVILEEQRRRTRMLESLSVEDYERQLGALRTFCAGLLQIVRDEGGFRIQIVRDEGGFRIGGGEQ